MTDINYKSDGGDRRTPAFGGYNSWLGTAWCV